jgi:hypothetical protein
MRRNGHDRFGPGNVGRTRTRLTLLDWHDDRFVLSLLETAGHAASEALSPALRFS